MTYNQLSGKTIDEAFAEFDAANPHIYQRFKELSFSLIASGRARYSSKTILCVIRFERDMQTTSDDGFKINDIVTSRYSRKFSKEFPQHEDFFEQRELRSERRRTTEAQAPG